MFYTFVPPGELFDDISKNMGELRGPYAEGADSPWNSLESVMFNNVLQV